MPEDHEAALLAAYDEALAAGLPTLLDAEALDALGPEAAARLREDLASLEMLKEMWPRGRAASPAPTGPVPGIPAEVGRFRVLCELGRGGHGVVLLAFDPSLKRQVALKVPRPEMLLTQEMRQRFLHEARAAAGLDHPGIVPVYEAGEAGPICYIVSSYCSGSALNKWLQEQRGPIAPRMAAALATDLAEAVAYTHDRGILHRDLKPANVLLVPRAESKESSGPSDLPFVPKLTDFGLAKSLEASLIETRTSVLLGTPLYMAPEQADSRLAEVGPATDVYGLGILLYEMLTGRTPFTGTSVAAVLDQVCTQEPPPLRSLRPDVPAELAVVCHKCLQKEPTQRYASAGELAADLRAWLKGEPIAARLPGPLARLNVWSLRRERIRDAGLLAIVINAANFIYLIAWIVFVLFGVGSELRSLQATIVQTLLVAGLINVPLVGIGFKTLAARRWALWAGLGMSLMTLTSLITTMLLPSTDPIERDFAELLNLFLLFVILWFTQALAYGLALRAFYHLHRERGHWTPNSSSCPATLPVST
jgi:tRNA A-37 threonylcarbamoyl transferase component Bud32